MGLLAVDLTNRISDLQPATKKALPANQRKGVSFPKYFTQKLEAGKTPYDEINWELRTAAIASDKGAIIFEQDEVEVPADWSQTATNIVVSKYFYGKMGSPERERSVRQLVHRVVDTIADWGAHGRYFKTARRRRKLPRRAGAPDADAEGLLQFAGVVQRGRHRSRAATAIITTKPPTTS